MCIVLPIKIKKATDKDQNVNAITVNNFFCCWLKEIDARRYPDDVRILWTNNTVEFYQYAAQQLNIFQVSRWYKRNITLWKKAVVLNNDRDRRSNTSTTPADRTDSNLGKRVTDFLTLIGQKIYYRIPLGFFTSLGPVNFLHKIDTRFLFTLETNLNRLFERNAKLDKIPGERDAQIIFHDTSYISYPQITLDDNFLAYFNTTLRSRSALRTGVILSPYQQNFEINVGTQSLKVNFRGLNKQIEWLEISLVCGKSAQDQTVYDSCDVQLAAKYVQLLALENASTTSSLTGKLEYNVSNEDYKDWLYQMFVAYYCERCSAAPITQCKNNEIKLELKKEKNYFGDKSDKRLYIDIDMRRSKGYIDELKKFTRDDGGVA